MLAHRTRSERARFGQGRVMARLGWVGEMDARSKSQPKRRSGEKDEGMPTRPCYGKKRVPRQESWS